MSSVDVTLFDVSQTSEVFLRKLLYAAACIKRRVGVSSLNRFVFGGLNQYRGLRVTVGTGVGLVPSGYSIDDILKLYPYLEEEDIREALAYAAWRAEEIELPLTQCRML
jgi:uncharacterized protein (DUF433 family)